LTLLSVAAVVLVTVAAGAWLALRPRGSSSTPAENQLTATSWVLAGYTGTAAGRSSAALPGLRLQFKDGRIWGDDGCNSFGGPVTISGDQLTFGELASTAMGCAKQAPLSRYLTGTVTWRVSHDRLVITKDGVGTLNYQPQRSGGPEQLLGRAWVLQGIETGSSTDRTLQPLTDSTLVISAGRMRVQMRCGTFVAQADVAGTALVLRHSQFLGHRCPALSPDGQKTEKVLTATLRHVLTGTVPWSISGDVLKLGRPAEGPVLVYRANGADTGPNITNGASVSGTATVVPAVGVAAGLANRTWYLVVVTGSSAGSSALRAARTVPTLAISSAGAFVATVNGCPFYQGRLRVHRTALTITPGLLSPCPATPPGDGGQQEAASELFGLIDSQLAGTLDWRVRDGRLSLSRPSDHTVLIYADRKADRKPATAVPGK
jgi:heat shock protein HslJ